MKKSFSRKKGEDVIIKAKQDSEVHMTTRKTDDGEKVTLTFSPA